jgi:protein O-mannosyl-transferase
VNSQSRNRPTRLVILLALGLMTLALYLPVLSHQFLDYDDQQYVTENPHVRAGLSGPGFLWAFGYHAGNWHPLTWVSHMLDCQLYGVQPWGHHLTNVLLHVANTLLLFLVLRRLTSTTWRSAAVAALFAWHPLHVESVAWVAERKDVLSSMFFMLTLWGYGRYAEAQSQRPASSPIPHQEARVSPHRAAGFYLLSLGFFALGLMSKPMLVTLPFVLLLLDYWPLRRWQPWGSASQALLPLLREKIPFLILTACGSVLTLAAQQPAIVSTKGLPVFQRLEHALVSYLHYFGALLAPRHMAVYYPYQKAAATSATLLAGVVLLLLTGLAFRLAARRPYVVTGWLWFLGMLVPVIGLVQVGDQAWADRYSYLPSVGLFIAVVWGLGDWALERGRQVVLWGLAGGVGAALLIGTSLQLRYWKDTRTLFEHTAAVTTNNPLALSLLGSLLAKDGKLDQAQDYYRAALRIQPGFPEAQFFLANALDQQGQLDEAIALYQKALWFKPSQVETHIFLGAALAKQKKYEAAVAHYRAALALNPESAIAHNNLARVLHTQGHLDDAITHYSAAVELDPSLAEAHNNLGVLLLQSGKLAEGSNQLRESLRLKPHDPQARINLAQALTQQQQWMEAVELFRESIAAGAPDPNIHSQYALALSHVGRLREARSHYATAALLKPELTAALEGLAWILATAADPQLRDGNQAVALAERACDLTGRKDPIMLKTLAAAYAEVGRFAEAIAGAQAAEALAAQSGDSQVCEDCRQMIAQFKGNTAWREKR